MAAAEAWNSKPGFVKIRDLNGDKKLDADDRQIIGQTDPQFLWGLGNTFSYKNFNLIIFVHGVHGVTRRNEMMTDRETWGKELRRNTIKKNWWTPGNPTNDFVINHMDAELMSGIRGLWYENASFIRVKDITISYDFPGRILQRAGMSRIRLYVTGRNLATVSEWNGMDPELSGQLAAPLQKEFVFGLNLGL